MNTTIGFDLPNVYVSDTGDITDVGGYSQIPVNGNDAILTTTDADTKKEDFTPVRNDIVVSDTPTTILPNSDDATIKSIAALVANMLGINNDANNAVKEKQDKEKTKQIVIIAIALVAAAVIIFFTFKR